MRDWEVREEWCSLGKSWKRGVEEKNEKEVEVTWQRVRRGGRMGNSEHKCIWTRTRWSCCRCTCGLSCSVMSDSLQLHGVYSPWNSPGQNTGVGSLSLLQGIFLTQGLNPGLPHCRWILYQLNHNGSPRILEWVDYPFPVDLPDPEIELGSPALQEDSLPTELPGKPHFIYSSVSILTYLF